MQPLPIPSVKRVSTHSTTPQPAAIYHTERNLNQPKFNNQQVVRSTKSNSGYNYSRCDWRWGN